MHICSWDLSHIVMLWVFYKYVYIYTVLLAYYYNYVRLLQNDCVTIYVYTLVYHRLWIVHISIMQDVKFSTYAYLQGSVNSLAYYSICCLLQLELFIPIHIN